MLQLMAKTRIVLTCCLLCVCTVLTCCYAYLRVQVLLMVAPVLLMLVLPRLMKSMGPEQQKVCVITAGEKGGIPV